MPRVMEIVTPLGEDVLLFHGMSAREEMSRLFEYQLDLLSTKRRHQPRRHPRQERHHQARAARRRDAVLQRLRHAVLAGRHARPLPPLRRDRAAVAVVPDPHRRLPDLPGDDRPRHHQGGVRGSSASADFKFELTGTYRTWTYCVQYRETDFNFVSRLMEQEGICYYFRHTDGHNTLVLTDSTSKHTPVAGLREAVVHRADGAGASRTRARQRLGLLARDPAGRLRARRLRFRAAERRAQDQQGAAARLHAERLRGLRLSRAATCRSRTASSTRRCASTSSAASSRSRRRRPTRAG